MFNKFPTSTCVFYITDMNGRLIPLVDFSSITADELFQVYVAINDKHSYTYTKGLANLQEQKIVYRAMMDYIYLHQTKKISVDSIRLMKYDFWLQEDALFKSQSILGTYHVE